MAAVLVQKATVGGGGTTTQIVISTSSTEAIVATTAGNTLVAKCHIRSASTITVSSVVDSASNTWTLQTSAFQGTANDRVEIWTSVGAASVTSVTMTPSTAVNCSVCLEEISGVTTPVTTAGAGAAASTTPAAVTVTAVAGSIVSGAISYGNTTAPSALASPFTAETGDSRSTFYGANAYDIPGSGTTEGPAWTLPASVQSGACTVTFALASSTQTITGGSTALTLTPASGSLAATGTATISGGATALALTPAAGALTGTGTATITGGTAALTLTPVAGALTATGTAMISGGSTALALTPAGGTLTATGTATIAGSSKALVLSPVGGSLVATGTATIIGGSTALILTPGAGTLSLVGGGLQTITGGSTALILVPGSGTLFLVPIVVPPVVTPTFTFTPPLLPPDTIVDVRPMIPMRGFRLWRHVAEPPPGVNVFVYPDGTVTNKEPITQDQWDVVAAFYGGHGPYRITSAQAAALVAAGYSVEA